MVSRSTRVGLSVVLAVVAAAEWGCSPRSLDEGPPSPPLPSQPGGDGGDPSCQELRCSSDLTSVVDNCTGQVVEACSVDTACGGGRCIDPCQAAKLSPGSIGCDFTTIAPSGGQPEKSGYCFAAFVANSGRQPVTISVEYPGMNLHSETATRIVAGNGGKLDPYPGYLDPGKAAVIFLSQADPRPTGPEPEKVDLGCPVDPLLGFDPVRDVTWVTHGFRIRASGLASAYSIYPFGGAKSYLSTATLLLPVTSWGTEYRVVNPLTPLRGLSSSPFTQIVASEDNTTVKLTLNHDLAGGDGLLGAPAAASKGMVSQSTLQAGEVLQIVQSSELTGSFLIADKPVGLFGGNQSMNIPGGGPRAQMGCCSDILQQQIAPLATWGSEFAMVPPPQRYQFVEPTRYRLVAAADGTALTYDGSMPSDFPSSLNAGDFVDFTAVLPFVVKSQDSAHPFFAATYMYSAENYPGGSPGGILLESGDPEFTTLVPTAQFLEQYRFYVDTSYRDSTITFVRRQKPGGGFAPITLDCAGEVTGFAPVDSSGKVEVAYVRVQKAYVDVAFGGGVCGVGFHDASSEEPFGIYVWGLDKYVSYGYPGGTGLRPISTLTQQIF